MLVLCHVSHVYASGASLYFTVLTKADDDPIAQWHRAKLAANAAIRGAGATITHHHGVGTDHRETYAQEIGPLGVDVLRAVKASLDPAGDHESRRPGRLTMPHLHRADQPDLRRRAGRRGLDARCRGAGPARASRSGSR